jgi:uncharacterized membrane protein
MPKGTTALAVVLVISGGVLAGCGGSNPYALPKYDPKAAVAATASDSTPFPSSRSAVPAAQLPAAVKYRPADPWGQGAWVERGKIIPTSAKRLAAVAAVQKYLSVWVQLSNTWQVDDRALAAVASGAAITTAHERAQRQREENRRSVGRFIINVSSVKVSGSSASVTGCSFDATSEVDRDGNVLVAPPGGVKITMKLRRTGNTWRVIELPKQPVPFCDWRN